MNMRKTVSFLKSLYHLGKIRLTDDGPEILDQNVLIVPQSMFTELISLYADHPEMEQAVYGLMKDAVYDFCNSIDEHKRMSRADMLQLLLNLTRMNGYGKIEINDYNLDNQSAVFFIRDLPSADLANRNDGFKADTYWAGMLAGGMSYVFETDVDALETQCILEGKESCRFFVAPEQTLATDYPSLHAAKFDATKAAESAPTMTVDR